MFCTDKFYHIFDMVTHRIQIISRILRAYNILAGVEAHDTTLIGKGSHLRICQIPVIGIYLIVTVPAFEPATEEQFQQAAALLRQCGTVLDAGTPVGSFNQCNARLLRLAEEEKLPVYRMPSGV